MLLRDYYGYEREHVLERLADGGYACSACRLTWQKRPKTFCAGVPVYAYGAWPENLYTYTQLRRDLHMKPIDREQPDGAYFLRKSPYRRWLYSIERSVPRRRMVSEKQLQAVVKMREGLVRRYTCQRCGYYDPSHGQQKYAKEIRDGWCVDCWNYYHRCGRRREQQAWAAKYVEEPFLVLDTETTGLSERDDEVIEIAIVDGLTGGVVFQSLAQPEDIKRPSLATHIHGITRGELSAAPRFPDIWPEVERLLWSYRRVLVYNASFDYGMLKSTARRYGFAFPPYQEVLWECLMEQFARYNGAWSEYWGGFSWCKLGDACRGMQVSVEQQHRALGDTLLARGLLYAIIERPIETLEPPKKVGVEVMAGFVELDNLDGLEDLDDHPF